ncbi:PREDICTED: protein rolling stone-like [Priapulus caudatus]|uniref:Protein rolling stone-like n=1 Tax=Priapulus caudatus TaxID=37621 RepID=A0ABM1EQD7_PRICU|nr:PREDICTED: protein rolling stone-like [Priapulus caudatus]
MPADVIEAHAHCSQAPYRWYHTVTWLLYSASYPAALVISGGFWVLIHRRGDPIGLSAAVTHASNSIYVLLDMCVSAVPVRVLHVWVPQCWCLCYAVFSFLYYLYGGTGLYELPFIYPFIDYGETPGVAIGFLAVALLLLLPLAQVALYVMYMVRRFVYARACGMAEEEDEDERQRTSVPV